MNVTRLIREAHRRFVWQAAVIHLMAAFLAFHVSRFLAVLLNLDEWFPWLALVLVLLGLPVVVTTAYLQEGLPGAPRAGTAGPGARRLFTWRNALLGGIAAALLWLIVAAGWLMLAEEIVNQLHHPASVEPVEGQR